MSPDDDERDRKRKSMAFQFLQLGSMNAIILMIWFGIGLLIDERLHTIPIFLMIGLLAGIGTCAYVTYRLMSQFFKD